MLKCLNFQVELANCPSLGQPPQQQQTLLLRKCLNPLALAFFHVSKLKNMHPQFNSTPGFYIFLS